MSRPGGSIIIPTHEDWPSLERTLAATVHDCRQLPHRWEVIVVDNESGPAWIARFRQAFGGDERIRLIRRTGLGGRHFQPGAARNAGIDAARHDWLVFLDSDCIPASALVRVYWRACEASRHTVFIGHRRFVESAPSTTAAVVHRRDALSGLPPVRSRSNYGDCVDRRLPELWRLATHVRPYDCLYACNFAMHRDCLGDLRFDPVFDGHWGYEDIELGHRLHGAGRRFAYLPDALVYHQEAARAFPSRCDDRLRNFELAASLIPGFLEHRLRSARVGALPDELQKRMDMQASHAD